MLNLADLLNELVCEHVDKQVQLISDTEEHITDVILPISDRARHILVIPSRLLSEVFKLCKVFESALIAFVNKVDLTFVNQALNTSIGLLFLLPEVEWKSM